MTNRIARIWERLRRVDHRFLMQRVMTAVFAPLGIIGALALRVVNLFRPIQLGGINAGRLGHLVFDVEMFLAEREIGAPGYRKEVVDLRYVWTAGLPIANNLILNLWRPLFTVGPRWILQPVDMWNHKIPGGTKTQVPWRKAPNQLNQHNDLHGALSRTAPHLPITNDHFDSASKILADIRPGFDIRQPYVCIHVRDDGYFKEHQPHNRDDETRNANIADYESAISFLVSKGIHVVRMGAVVQNSLALRHDYIWDYASDGSRSELLDLVLPARCMFFISTLSGPDKIAQLFRRPVLFTNLAPLKNISLWMTDSLITPKRLRNNEGQFLDWSTVFSTDTFTLNQTQLAKRGVQLISNSSQEIRMSVDEMLARLNHDYSTSTSTDQNWQQLLNSIPSHLKAGGVRARLSAASLSGPT